MNEELKIKIESAINNDMYWNDETMTSNLIKQGYKKEDIDAILVLTKKTESNTVINFFGSIWFLWIFTTVIYILLEPQSVEMLNPNLAGYITGFVGLFVPYGPLSLYVAMFLPVLTIVSLVFFVIAMLLIDKKLKKRNFPLYKKILLNLFALFIITMIVDIIRGTLFGSIIVFLNGGTLGLPASM